MSERCTKYTFDSTEPTRPKLLAAQDLPVSDLPEFMRGFVQMRRLHKAIAITDIDPAETVR